MSRLTEAQRRYLQDFANWGRLFVLGNPAPVRRLLKRRMLQKVGSEPEGAAIYAITPSGRAALEQRDE